MAERTQAANKKEAVVKLTEEVDLMADLSVDGKIIVAAINDRLDKMREEIMEELRRCLEAKDREILQLQDEVSDLRTNVVTLEERVSKMEEKVDAADVYERRDTLVFSGRVSTR